jgi:hypothetical protein
MRMPRVLASLLPLLLIRPEYAGARAAGDVPALFKPTHDPRTGPRETDPAILREQAISVDLRLARDPQTKRLQLPLFDGTSLNLTRDQRKEARKGSVIWRGHVDGQPASEVILSIGKDVLIGNISTPPAAERKASFYEIRYLGNHTHVFQQIDQSRISPESSPMPPEALRDSQPTRDEPLPTCATDRADTIDALIVYTPAARAAANGNDAIENAIGVFVDETNASYENSGIAQRLRLVNTQEVSYQESGDTANDLTRLKVAGGQLGDVHGLRDTYGADVVALIVEYPRSRTRTIGCGISYIMEDVSNAFESSAFAVVPRLCADAQYSLGHELGHIMGARHDWTVEEGIAGNTKPFAFSHGYVHLLKAGDHAPAFRTMMAYSTECGDEYCARLLYWSNPGIVYPQTQTAMGVSTGTRQSNNAETLNETAKTVANFRCSKSTPGP